MSLRSESGVRGSADAYGSLVRGVQGGSLWTLTILQLERDLFLMARQEASCPLDVSPPSELCCSCERVQAALGVGGSILAAHPQLLPSCGFLSSGLFSSFVPVPPSSNGTAYCPQPQGSWHDNHILWY